MTDEKRQRMGSPLWIPHELVYFNTSRKLNIGPALVFSVHVAGDGDDVNCSIYDGLSSGGTLKIYVQVKSGYTEPVLFQNGVKFDKGIYVAPSGTAAKCCLEFIPYQQWPGRE